MKLLTIEQLKALPDGEYFWLVEISGMYVRKVGCTEENMVVDAMPVFEELRFADYGTKWLAYKNKEQAEIRGEIVELPCKVGDNIYIVEQVNDKEWEILQGSVKSFAISENKNVEICARYDCGLTFRHCNGEKFYLNKSEAERRIAELKGE